MTENTEFTPLWRKFRSELRSFILSKVNNEADTEDILQEVYIKIHKNIHSLKDSKRLKSWIFQITRNEIIDFYREKSHKPELYEVKQILLNSSSSDAFMQIALRDMIKFMDKMPDEYCDALCKTELEGVSQKDYAKMAGLSYSGAKSRIQRGRIMLREMMLKCCHYQFDNYGSVYNIEPNCCCCTPIK